MPREEWSPQRSGGGHTFITSHGYYRCSNASYGGRCPVGHSPKWRGGACLMAGVCPGPENSPNPIGVPVNPGGGHGYYRCSNASYGGRCPVGQRPNSTKMEGWCLPDGWRLPHESRGWPNSREGGLGPRAGERYQGREMLNWSGRAGELGGRPGLALFPLPKGYPSEMTGSRVR